MQHTRLAFSILLLCAACDGPRATSSRPAARVLAVVAGQAITADDFAARIASLPERERPHDRRGRERVLRELCDDAVLLAEAKRRALDRDPAVRAAQADVLAEAQLARWTAPPRVISSAEVEGYYRRNANRYAIAERRRVQAMAFRDAGAARLARANAKLWQQLDAGDVGSTAGSVSGHVGPPGDPDGASASVAEPLRRAVFELARVGDVSAPIVHDGRHWLVRYAGHTAAQLRPLAPEHANIVRILSQERLAAERRRIALSHRQRTALSIDVDALAEVVLPSLYGGYDPRQWKK